MKFSIQINNVEIIFDYDQVQALMDLIEGAPFMSRKWVGTGKGTNGGDYIDALGTVSIRELMRLTPVSEENINALKLVTAAQNGK